MKQLVLLLALALACGCGNLSNDDLVFLSGIPRAEEVAVGIESDTNPNALTGLVGEPAEYYSQATDVAAFFDAIVGTSIDFVEQLGWNYTPTYRTESTRVWGPAPNVGDSGVTVRLEIRRDQLSSGEPMFTFCLHAGPDALSLGVSPSCENPAVGGMRLLMWGSFVPRATETDGRAGRGEIHIDFEAIHALDASEEARGLLTVGYDFTGGGAARALHIEWVRIVSLTNLSTERVEYDFSATEEGQLGFNFVLEQDVYADAGVLGFTDNEVVEVEACWSEDGPGRADISMSDGDFLFGETAHARECWDPHHARSYWLFEIDGSLFEEEGEVTLCPATCPQ